MENTNVRDQLRRVLAEWHDFALPALVHRDADDRILDKHQLVTVVGPRRAGKTWFCYQMMQRLLAQGVPRANVLYVNLEDERLYPLTGEVLTALLDVQEELYAEWHTGPRYCIVDEVQNAPQWSVWARRVVEQQPELHLALTGSSSKLLSTEIATELRGRARTVVVAPYSFAEFARAAGADSAYTASLVHGTQRNTYQRLFAQYMASGGFPAVQRRTDSREMLQEYYRAMFTRDMIERFRVQSVRLFEDYLTLQISRFAALSSLSGLQKELAELGHVLSRSTLSQYLSHAQEAFLLFSVPLYSPRVRQQMRAPRKVYAVDHGLLNAIRFSATEDRGRLLENMVFMELWRRHGQGIYYHAGEHECDFLVRDGTTVVGALQACWSLADGRTREREVAGMLEALQAHHLDSGTIVTEADEARLQAGGKTVHVRPYWHWALELAADRQE